jgi:hypothetical protein
MTHGQRKDLHHKLRSQARVEAKAWLWACLAIMIWGLLIH